MERSMSQIREAAAKQDVSRLKVLTERASELRQMSDQLVAIRHRLISFTEERQTLISSEPRQKLGFRELRIEVTQGMINQNLLTLTEALKRGLIRVGEELTVECLPGGERFKTVMMSTGNKLQERGAIGRFYREAHVSAGDFVVLKEVSQGSWQLFKYGNAENNG